MGRFKTDSLENKLKVELQGLFAKGERFSLRDIITTRFNPNTPYKYLIAEKRVRQILSAIKKDFLKEKVAFGSLNADMEHGIPASKAEFEYMGIKRYKFFKGIIINSGIIADMGVRQGYIKLDSKTETIKLPRMEE